MIICSDDDAGKMAVEISRVEREKKRERKRKRRRKR